MKIWVYPDEYDFVHLVIGCTEYTLPQSLRGKVLEVEIKHARMVRGNKLPKALAELDRKFEPWHVDKHGYVKYATNRKPKGGKKG